MNKNIFLGLTLVVFCNPALAADIACHGNIAQAMADHPGCADTNGKRQMAFKTNLSSNPWMCARTNLGSSVVLAASMAGKSLQVYVSDQGSGYNCSNIPAYSKVSYIILNNT